LVSITEISPDLMVRVAGGFGEYPIRSLVALLRLDQADEQTILAAYNFALYEVIDEVYFLDYLPPLEDRRSISRLLWGMMGDYWRTYYQLPSSLLATYFFIQNEPSIHFNRVVHTQEDLASLRARSYAAVGRSVECPVVVVNATDQTGLATRVAGLLERDGFWVARITSGEREIVNTTLFYDSDLAHCQDMKARLQRVFPRQPELIEDRVRLRHYRASLVIVLGQDIQP
jgi:hypothetical protein